MSGPEQEDSEPKGSSGVDKVRNPTKSFQVVIRLCTPEQDHQTDEGRSSIKVIEPNRIVVDTGRGHQPHSLDFDAVWDEFATQRDVYESTAKPLVESLMRGYNGCVITYGSPASGKTYTMLGGSVTGKQRGIISRAAEDIFSSTEASHCKIRVSFLHISNEKIYDLLACPLQESQPAEVCRIHEGEEAVLLEGLREVEVGSTEALLQLYRHGSANRHAGISKGEFASKSHTIFNIVVINTKVQTNYAQEGVLNASKLTLVDLASSGKAPCRINAATDMRRCFQTVQENPQEVKMLKRSLAIFGNVIFALSTAGCQHIPYRESKLTRVLRDCLGGNCQTSLIVTVSPHLSSVTETLRSLQFASRAMAVPRRAVHCSQLQCSPLQVQSVRTTGKTIPSTSRQQTLLPINSDKRLQAQTCLPPILSGPAPHLRLSHRRSDEPEHKAFLPQLDRLGQDRLGLAEAGGHYAPPGRGARPSVEKAGGVDGRTARALSRSRSHSSSLAGVALQEAGGREWAGRGEVHPSPWREVERLSSTTLAPSTPQPLPAPPECPNCARERKIREEYDKYIVQARRDRDALSQRVAELEAQLWRRGPEGPRTTETAARTEAVEAQKKATSTMVSKAALLHLEEENNQKEILIVGLQREVGALQGQLDQCEDREKMVIDRLHADMERATLDAQEPRVQLERARARDTQQICSLHNQRENLQTELQNTKVEQERFRETIAFTVAQLRQDKAELISHIEDSKRCYEKVRAENAGLREQVEDLLKETNSRPRSGAHGNTGPSHVHTVTTNTEMLVVSHHVSQQCTTGIPLESKCCFNGCGGFQDKPRPDSPETSCEPTNTSSYEPSLHKSKDAFKQLRREHNLLLDVMLILYKREWFVEDAMPYVKRTLRKCGMRLEMD